MIYYKSDSCTWWAHQRLEPFDGSFEQALSRTLSKFDRLLEGAIRLVFITKTTHSISSVSSDNAQ